MISSIDRSKGYHQLTLSGDLPVNQGPPNTSQIRWVKLTIDAGIIGAEDFISPQSVTFDADGRPVHIQDVSLSVVATLQKDETVRNIMLSRVIHMLGECATNPTIDLTD